MYWIEDISILLYFGLATLYFGEFDVLFQYLFVHDPTNFREEPKKDCRGKPSAVFFRFYNLFWGAKVTVQIRVLSASTFFNKKIGICTQILYN